MLKCFAKKCIFIVFYGWLFICSNDTLSLRYLKVFRNRLRDVWFIFLCNIWKCFVLDYVMYDLSALLILLLTLSFAFFLSVIKFYIKIFEEYLWTFFYTTFIIAFYLVLFKISYWFFFFESWCMPDIKSINAWIK